MIISIENKTWEALSKFLSCEREKRTISERIESGFSSSSDKELLKELERKSDTLFQRWEESVSEES